VSKPGDSPIPAFDLLSITSSVARIESCVNSIREDVLPPVADSAKKASEGVIALKSTTDELGRRVGDLEQDTHSCINEERLVEHGQSISKYGVILAELERRRIWIAGVLVTIALALFGITFKTIWDVSAANSLLHHNGKTIISNTNKIRTVDERTKEDREQIINEIRLLPNKVKINHIIKPDNHNIDSSNLTRGEKRQLRKLLRKTNSELADEL
jgi:hypothetical protein